VILAAGRSRRFGRRNKLLTTLDAQPLWWRALAAAFASRARPLVVVLGRRPRPMLRSLAAFRRGQRRSLPVRIVINRDHARGLSSSVRAGLVALPADTTGAVMILADMPQVDVRLIDALIAAYAADDAAVLPRSGGRRGNPVLLGGSLFAAADRLRGDEGFRSLLADAAPLRFVETDAAATVDVDTRRDHARLRRRISRRSQMRRPRHPL
jgi:molybdenum cofactor cytidylyltransferase